MPHYLAIDLGASSGRAILGHLDSDPDAPSGFARKALRDDPKNPAIPTMTLEEIHRFETPSFEDDGHLYWDLAALTSHVKTSLATALEIEPTLRSVSVDSWAVDYVPLDGDGAPLRDPHCYRDTRTEGMIERAFQSISRKDLYGLTGIQYLDFNTLFQLLADIEHQPELFAKTRNRLLIADYFNHVLGGKPAIDLSMASTTHMLDAKTQEWSPEILEAFGIRPDTLPDIVPPGTVIGWTDKSLMASVVAGCSHDTGAAVAAVPADDSRDDWCYISLGTWALIGVESPDPILTEDALRAGFTNEVGLGGQIRFLKNLVGMWPLQECMREWRESTDAELTYDKILGEAAESPHPDRFVDLLDPRFGPPGGMEDRLLAYCSERGMPQPETRGALVRLILASIANSISEAVKELEDVIKKQIRTIHVVGGGSQNALVCQMTADATGCRITAGPVEATALGNLLIQARTMGDLPEGVSIRDVVRNSFDVVEYSPAAPKPRTK